MSVQSKALPDGTKVFWDDTKPLEQTRTGLAPNYLSYVSHDGGKTWSQDPNQDPNWASKPSDLENFVLSQAPAKTLGDTLGTLAKAAPAMLGAPAASGGFGNTGAFGYGGGGSMGNLYSGTTGGGGDGYGAPGNFGSQPVSTAASGGSNPFSSPNIWSSIISNAFSFLGAKQAADTSKEAAAIQAASIDKATALAYQAQQNTLAFQKQQWDTTQRNMAPWLRTGQSAITTLGKLLGLGGGSSPATPVGPGTLASTYAAGPSAPMMAAPAASSPAPAYTRITWNDGHTDSVPTTSLDQYKLLGAKVGG